MCLLWNALNRCCSLTSTQFSCLPESLVRQDVSFKFHQVIMVGRVGFFFLFLLASFRSRINAGESTCSGFNTHGDSRATHQTPVHLRTGKHIQPEPGFAQRQQMVGQCWHQQIRRLQQLLQLLQILYWLHPPRSKSSRTQNMELAMSKCCWWILRNDVNMSQHIECVAASTSNSIVPVFSTAFFSISR